VQVDEEPRPVEAHDVSPPPKPQPLPIVGWRPTTSAPPAVITNKTSESPASLSAAVPTENQVEEPKPKSFWAKVNPVKWANPVRWFKGDAQKPEPAETKPTPLEVSGPVAASTIANAGQPAPAPATLLTPTPAEKPVVESKPAPPPKPVFPRYQRRGADRLLEGDRAAAEPEFGRGSDAQQHRDWITAIAAYRQALQLDPAYFEAHYNLCIAALEQGDLNLALIASDNALLLQPDNENARLNYAVALQRSGYPLDAVEQYEKVLAKRPNDANLEIVAASLCARDLKDNARARAHYEKALALNPQHPKAQAIRQWLAGN
jgi:Flp pilus assembly protein TadD